MQVIRCRKCMGTMPENGKCPICGFDNTGYEAPNYVLRPDTILHGKYLIGCMLGQGGFGITYIGFDLSLEIKVAVKEYFPANLSSRDEKTNMLRWNTGMLSGDQWQKGCDSFLKEARKMAKINTIPEIVGVRETFIENNTAYIVMDYVEGITLKNWLDRNGIMKFGDCVNLMLPLMQGLDKVHQQGIIHRDISPDNIMLQSDGKLRLLDLGAAKDLASGNKAASELVARNGFSPIEQYMENGSIGPWTDVYALCATIYYCVTGRVIPNSADRLDNETLDFKNVKTPLTENQKSVLSAGLSVKYDKRIKSVAELTERIKSTLSDSDSASKDNFFRRHFKLAIGVGVGSAAVMAVTAGVVFFANSGGQQAEILGCSNSNLYQGSNYASYDGQYNYYSDKEKKLYVVPYGTKKSEVLSGTAVDESADYINIGADKIYFVHNSNDIMSMEFDGSKAQTVINGENYQKMQYVKTTDAAEYLYYLKEDENPDDELYTLCRYELAEKTETLILSESVHWFNIDGKYIYYTAFPSDGKNESILKRARLDGKNIKTLNNTDSLTEGYIEDGGAYMLSSKEEKLRRYDLNGKKSDDDVSFGKCSVYNEGWIYYSDSGSGEVHRAKPDGKNDSVLFKGKNIVNICFADSDLWIMQGEEKNGKKTLNQQYIMLYDGSYVCPVGLEAEMLGCSGSNAVQAGNYACIKDKYEYYADKEWNLYVVAPDETDNTFYISDQYPAIDDEVGYINIGTDKVYFIHDEETESGNNDSIMQMDFDGSNVKELISDGQYLYMQYAKLSDGGEYLYYSKDDENTGDLFYELYRYDLKENRSEKLLTEKIYNANVYGSYIYYTTFPEGDPYNSEWKRADLNGGNAETLDKNSALVYGYVEDDMAYMVSLNDQILYQYSLDGKRTGNSLEIFDGVSVYGDGWIYYSITDSNEVHKVRPDGSGDNVIFEGKNIIQLGYADSWLWMLQGKTVNGEIIRQQTYLMSKDGSQVLTIESEYTDKMPDGLEYKIENNNLILTNYTGDEKRIIVPWTVDGTEVEDIQWLNSFPDDVDIYVYPKDNEISYEFTEDGNGVVIIGYGGGITDGYSFLAIPPEINGLPVMKIGKELFLENQNIQGVILPEGLSTIGVSAFKHCENLSYVKLPDTLEVICDSAFSFASSLEEIVLPEGLEEIDWLAFFASGLKEITIPSTVNLIYGNPFATAYLKSVKLAEGNSQYRIKDGALFSEDGINVVPNGVSGRFEVPDGINYVASYAFSCSSVTEVVLPNTINEIYNYAFLAATRLTKIVLPDSVAKIGSNAFRSCTSLREIVIPETVQEIDSKAFQDCDNLLSVTISRSCKVADDAFGDNTKIYYYN